IAAMPDEARRAINDIDAEFELVQASINRLAARQDTAAQHSRSDIERSLIEAHRSLLLDRCFAARIHSILAERKVAAGLAVYEAAVEFSDELRGTRNPLLAARADDVADICQQLLAEIYGAGMIDSPPSLPE